LRFQPLINGLYYTSAAVGFARGLNDTPKLVGLLVCRLFKLPVNVLILAFSTPWATVAR
jgi:PiT family inorganic phosphate transporter